MARAARRGCDCRHETGLESPPEGLHAARREPPLAPGAGATPRRLPGQRVTTAVAGILVLAPRRPVDRARRGLAGEASLMGEAMVRPHAEAAFDARIAVPLPSVEHRARQGRGLQQRRQPLRPSLPGKDDRLDRPLPPDGARRAGDAQGGLRGDGPRRPRLLERARRGTLRRPELLLCGSRDFLLRADPWIGRRLLHGGGHGLSGRPLRPR